LRFYFGWEKLFVLEVSSGSMKLEVPILELLQLMTFAFFPALSLGGEALSRQNFNSLLKNAVPQNPELSAFPDIGVHCRHRSERP
jgi:hypothetical protein